ncbi:MAG: energy-coupling factor ABC transporter ATP-binding protein [Bacillota bacterium]
MTVSYINLQNVSYMYRGRSEPAVKKVSLELYQGESAVLTGLNGSGKSTLARLMLGLLKPQEGAVYLEGKPVSSFSLPEIGARLGYVLQDPSQMLFNTSVYNEVAFGLRWQGLGGDELAARCRYYLESLGLWKLRGKMPLTLSEGQKQLVAVCAVLALEPAILILDEPTRSIDTYHREILINRLLQIGKDGTGIMVITHDRDLVKTLGSREIKMQEGEVIADGS